MFPAPVNYDKCINHKQQPIIPHTKSRCLINPSNDERSKIHVNPQTTAQALKTVISPV